MNNNDDHKDIQVYELGILFVISVIINLVLIVYFFGASWIALLAFGVGTCTTWIVLIEIVLFIRDKRKG